MCICSKVPRSCPAKHNENHVLNSHLWKMRYANNKRSKWSEICHIFCGCTNRQRSSYPYKWSRILILLVRRTEGVQGRLRACFTLTPNYWHILKEINRAAQFPGVAIDQDKSQRTIHLWQNYAKNRWEVLLEYKICYEFRHRKYFRAAKPHLPTQKWSLWRKEKSLKCKARRPVLPSK